MSCCHRLHSEDRGVTIIFGSPANGQTFATGPSPPLTSNASSNRQWTALQNVSVYRVRHINSVTFTLSHWRSQVFWLGGPVNFHHWLRLPWTILVTLGLPTIGTENTGRIKPSTEITRCEESKARRSRRRRRRGDGVGPEFFFQISVLK